MISRDAQRLLRAAGFSATERMSVAHWRMDALNPTAWLVLLLRAALRRFHFPFHPSFAALRLARAVLRPIDLVFFRPIRLMLYAAALRAVAADGVAFRRVQNPGAVSFDAPEGDGPEFERGPSIVRWMLEKPWVARGPNAELRRLDHWWFANYYSAFEYVVFQAVRGETEVGWLVLSLADNPWGRVVKVLDHALPGELRGAGARHVMAFASEADAGHVETPDDWRDLFRPTLLVRLALRTERRLYLWRAARPGNAFANAMETMALKPTDGVAAFDASF